MRETVSVTGIFQIVIIFILLFAAIMALTINNSNAFGVKDEIINAIEANNGVYFLDGNGDLDERINEAMQKATYRTSGKCPANTQNIAYDEWYIGFDRNGRRVGSNDKASICIRKVNVTDKINEYYVSKYGTAVGTNDFITGFYYQVVVFYQLDLPIINQVYNFQTKGETKIFYFEG